MSQIDITFGAQISKVSVSVTAKDGVIRRTCKLVLAREFDHLLAEGLRGDARLALKSLVSGGLSEAVLPITGIMATGVLKAMNAEVTIPDLHGLIAKAKAAAGDDPSEPPTIKLEFEFEFAEKSWLFLGRNCSAQAEITIRSIQTEMEFGGRPGRGKNGGKGKRVQAEV